MTRPFSGPPITVSFHSLKISLEMTSFQTFEIDAKFLSLTISYQFKIAYLYFQSLSDVFIVSSTKEKAFSKFERGKLKLTFSDFSELESLRSRIGQPKNKLEAVVKLNNGSYEVDIAKDFNNKDLKTLKILSLECE